MRSPSKKLMLLFAVVAATATACGPTQQLVDPGDLQDTGATLTAQAPRATVVLVHGMGGFKNIGPIDYFFHVPALWRGLGAKVFVAAESSFQSIEARAGQLKQQLDGVSGPLVIVGHSQGGLDARWLVSKLGYAPRVKALLTIATPHRGSPIADVAAGLLDGPAEDVLNVVIGTLGWNLAGMDELTTSYMTTKFNPAVPDASGVTYWSWAGYASPLGLSSGSGWLHAPLLPTWTIMKAKGIKSDGIVPVDSQKWGAFQGTIEGDHIGEVNQPLGETPGFHALQFYTSMLQRMHDQGW
jgi:triacylglycerol lipase